MKHVPLYTHSRESAMETAELALWRESYHANIACAEAITKEIADNFDGYHLNENAARHVIDRFGFDRVNWVLQTTLQQKDFDGRFRQEHKDWAKGAFTHYVRDEMRGYLVDSHPAVLDGFIAQARQAWRELNLFDHTHCHEDTANQNFNNRILVLRPDVLADDYKNPDMQLFICSGGFGASPGARGRKVYGQFLSDGELASFERQDFIGVLKEEHTPEWAQDKLEQYLHPEPITMREEPSL
ncbi:DUF3849 domain-containing protein [Ruminococcaceae bacterium OttesenSCG-928-L11]|nr:DUF3849 domain-containing protein [Ruminococcaceae bacterium OttesenSCG-928-L11]